jgi:hypothetical protein
MFKLFERLGDQTVYFLEMTLIDTGAGVKTHERVTP